MKFIYTQLFYGILMLLSINSLPISVSTLIAAEVDLKLSTKVEHLAQLTQLPVSEDALQRTYLIRHGESTANVYFEVEGKKVRYVSGESLSVPLTEKGRIHIVELAKKLATRFPK